MIYYLNLGFIVEQALCDVVKRYIDRQQFDDVYGNFHINVTNEHPFAHMLIDKNSRCADNFPSIVITSQTDNKPGDLMNMNPQYHGIGFTSSEIDELINLAYRKKTRINDQGEIEYVKKNGEYILEKIPGYVFVHDSASIQRLKDVADSRTEGETEGMVYGIKTNAKRRDKISVEIWCENNQLKNEIYEHLRILFTTTIEEVMCEMYEIFDPVIFDNSVSGERSSNYNYDFDTILCGSHITFEVDYSVSQILLDTSINNLTPNLILEVINHVKE